MFKHHSTAGMLHVGRGIYLTVGKEMYFLTKISQIRAQIFKAASDSNVTFVCSRMSGVSFGKRNIKITVCCV